MRWRATGIVSALPLLLAGATTLHLELVGSFPRADQTVGTPPVDISLIFSESADADSSSVALAGDDGPVPLGPIRSQDEGLVLKARVEGPMPPGRYTVTWRASAAGVEPATGAFRFQVR